MATGGEEQVGDKSFVHEKTILLENANEKHNYGSFVICQNKIIVVDNNDDKVKIYGLNFGNFLDRIDSDSKPCDICLMDATTICVLHIDGRIEIVSINSTYMYPGFKREKSFRLDNVFNYYHSVVKVHGNIVVVGVKEETTYWCIASLNDGHVEATHRICKWSFSSYVTTKDNFIYISCFVDVDDDDNGVYGFDILNPSECKYKYKHKSLQCPTSIAINEDGNIFVSDYLDSSIIQLTAFCQRVATHLAEILRADMVRVHKMFWDNGRLYVAFWRSRDIAVFPQVCQEESHKYRESSMIHEKKEHIRMLTFKEIEHVNDDKGQSNVKTAVPPSGQRPMDSESGKQDQNPDEITRFIECNKEMNFWKIRHLHNIQFFFSKSIIIRDIKQYGYNKFIQCRLRTMSNHLCKRIPGAMRVWCGYRTEDLHAPVFVVMFKNIIPEMAYSKPYDEYEIVFRKEHTPNDEEERISEQAEVLSIDKELKIENVVNCIAKNTERLMNEHSNLSIISASTVKATGFSGRLSTGKLKPSMCIVLYVPIKGIIPVGDKEFPKDIDGISTDVREGEFVFHSQVGPREFHSKLRMGCCITVQCVPYGTLGGFVDLPDGKTGCITAAHVVLSKKQRKQAMKKELTNGDILMYQPHSKYTAFGKVLKIAFAQGNENESTVDAALIEIIDHNRTPVDGQFPSGNYPVCDFTTGNPMMYNSGNIQHHSDIRKGSKVVKYGCTTGITCGDLELDGASVRMIDTEYHDASYPKYYRQMVVRSSGFSDEGDSGALVFVYKPKRVLEAIGLIVGGNTNGGNAKRCYVTPIKAVFTQLELGTHMFKHFPNINE